MKFNIFDFDQAMVISLVKEIVNDKGKISVCRIDVSDLLILSVISDFMNRRNIIKYTVDDKIYFSVQYKVILEDLPILNIKQQALSDRLDKLVMFNLLEKIVIKNQSGSYSAFRIGEEYESLKYKPTSSRLQVQEYSTTSAEVVNYEPKDSSTNNYSTNNYKEEDKSSLSKVDDLQEKANELYKLYPSKCPKRNVSTGKTLKDKAKLVKLMKSKDTSYEMLKFTIQAEIEERYNKQYMTNFSTFLNNLPDYGYNEQQECQTLEKEVSMASNGKRYR